MLGFLARDEQRRILTAFRIRRQKTYIDMTNLYNKTHYLDQRLKNFNIDPKYLTKSMFLKDLDNKVINYTVEHFDYLKNQSWKKLHYSS